MARVRPAVHALALLAVLWILDALLLNVSRPITYAIDVGGRGDDSMIRNAWQGEQDGSGTTYRWTQARTTIAVRPPAVLPGAAIMLEIGGLPAAEPKSAVFELSDTVQLSVQQAPQARAYHLLRPATAYRSGIAVSLSSEVQRVDGDPRGLGVRLDDAAIEPWRGLALPALPTLLSQWIIVLCCAAAPATLRSGPALVWAAGLAGVLIGIGMLLLDPLVANLWLLRGAAVAAALLAFVRWGVPLLERMPELGAPLLRRWLYLLLAVAVCARLAGVGYPRFGAHDLYIHRDRLADVRIGSLQLWDTPSEFGGRPAIVPSAFYVLASPLGLALGDADLALQWLFAAVDGAGVLLVALLARRLGSSERAALLAAVLVACLPIQYTALWWGFGPQVLGQWLLVLLAVLAADPRPPTRGRLLLATLSLTLALLAHPGVVTLGGVWLAAAIVLAAVGGRRAYALTWAGVLVASGSVAVALLYAEPLITQLQSLGSASSGNPGMDEATRLRLLWEALRSSFRPLGRSGALLAILAAVWWTRGPSRALILAWLFSALTFLLVDVFTGLQVRYSYFAVPVVCIGAGMLIDRLMQRRWSAPIGWGIVGFTVVAGLMLWYMGVVEAIKPTLTALTH